MAYVLAGVVGLVALILSPGVLFYFDVTPKLAVLLVGAAVVLLALGARGRSGWSTDKGPGAGTFPLLLGATFVFAAISTALSSNVGLSLWGSTWRRYGLLGETAVLAMAWGVSRVADRRTVVRGIAASSAVAAV